MTIQSSTQIGDVIRNAVVFNIKNWLGGMMNSDSLIQSVQDFFTILEQRKIDYVLVGGSPFCIMLKAETLRIWTYSWQPPLWKNCPN